jgi:uncharacterized protein YbaA (DUF1428 family)
VRRVDEDAVAHAGTSGTRTQCRVDRPLLLALSFCRAGHLSKLNQRSIPMSYVDGFLVPVRKNKVATYRRMAAKAGKIWREYGALEFRECIADDVKWGKRTSFPRSVKQKTGETVFLSYIVYKSRADRDRVNAKVMKDKRLAKMMELKDLPFDAKRMIWGGFKTVVAL